MKRRNERNYSMTPDEEVIYTKGVMAGLRLARINVRNAVVIGHASRGAKASIIRALDRSVASFEKELPK
jgi:hypothetical protein